VKMRPVRHSGLPAPLDLFSGSAHELLQIEGCLALEHEIDDPAEFVGKDGKGLGLAVLLGQAREVGLAQRVLAQEQRGGLRTGPLQVGVADLLAPVAGVLAVRVLLALHQAAIRGEVADLREAADVVDLVEDCCRS